MQAGPWLYCFILGLRGSREYLYQEFQGVNSSPYSQKILGRICKHYFSIRFANPSVEYDKTIPSQYGLRFPGNLSHSPGVPIKLSALKTFQSPACSKTTQRFSKTESNNYILKGNCRLEDQVVTSLHFLITAQLQPLLLSHMAGIDAF